MDLKSAQIPATRRQLGLAAMFLLLLAVLAFLFHANFLPGHTLFSNDGPLGAQMSKSRAVPDTFTGGWQDLNTLGFREGGSQPNITYVLLWILGPVAYSKFYTPICLLILGLGAWLFFRQSGLASIACM